MAADPRPSQSACSHRTTAEWTALEDRLHEAEAHLWALVVWLGGEYGHPHVNRDMQAAARYVNEHLTDSPKMTARHRAIIDRMGLR